MAKKKKEEGRYKVVQIGDGKVNVDLTEKINNAAEDREIIAVIGGNILVEN